jgi:hypothetical protein
VTPETRSRTQARGLCVPSRQRAAIVLASNVNVSAPQIAAIWMTEATFHAPHDPAFNEYAEDLPVRVADEAVAELETTDR